ncbi:MAG TPA: hypothetical protein VHC90_09230, partial [Bryobacteraceae bacterium]|nr:hypothetical protein [Bryobacteraceae bacterium]
MRLDRNDLESRTLRGGLRGAQSQRTGTNQQHSEQHNTYQITENSPVQLCVFCITDASTSRLRHDGSMASTGTRTLTIEREMPIPLEK